MIDGIVYLDSHIDALALKRQADSVDSILVATSRICWCPAYFEILSHSVVLVLWSPLSIALAATRPTRLRNEFMIQFMIKSFKRIMTNDNLESSKSNCPIICEIHIPQDT